MKSVGNNVVVRHDATVDGNLSETGTLYVGT